MKFINMAPSAKQRDGQKKEREYWPLHRYYEGDSGDDRRKNP